MKPKDLDLLPFDNPPVKVLPAKTKPPQLGTGDELSQSKQRVLRRIRRRQRRSLWH